MTATFYKAAIRTSAWRATRLIVPSKATRDELVRVLEADSTKIDVAYHGVDHDCSASPSQAQLDRVAGRLGLHGKPYVAYLGTLEPRKNVPALIAGWVRCGGRPGRPAGSRARRRHWLERRGRRRGGGRASPSAPGSPRLPALHRLARLLRRCAWSSRSPALARDSGCRCLRPWPAALRCLPRTELRCLRSAVTRSPTTEPDEASIKTALRGLIGDRAQREALGRAGHARSLEFTWAASAQAHLACYERAAAAGQG